MVTERSHKAELVWRIRDALEEEFANADFLPTAPTIVVGKYTGDLREGKLVLSVHASHPLGFGDGKHDAIAEGTPRDTADRPWKLPPESVGGSQWDRIYGSVQVRFVQDQSPQDAVEVIQEILTRIALIINSKEGLVPFQDKYGYQVFALRTSSKYGYASGGDQTAVDSHWCDFIARVSHRRFR